MNLKDGNNDLRQALLKPSSQRDLNDNNDGRINNECENENENENDGITNEEESNTIPFWGEDADDDSSSSSSLSEIDNFDPAQSQSTGQAILAIAVPALAALAIDPLMTIADTAFVGRTSRDAAALAGMGSSAALLTFSFYLFNFLCTVTAPLISQRRASGDEIGAIELGGQALSLALVLGILLSGVLLVFSGTLLDVMGTGRTGENSRKYALSFLRVRAMAAPAVFVMSASSGILRGYLDTRTTFVVLLGTNVVNLSLDFLLIGWLRMGPTGAAIATTTAEWTCALSLMLILSGKIPSVDGILGSNQQRRTTTAVHDAASSSVAEVEEESPTSGDSEPSPPQLRKTAIKPTCKIPGWSAMKPLVVGSSSVFVRSFMLHLSIAGAAAMATRSGEGSESASASIAAHQIALQLWLLCSFVCDALAAASQALVADRLGRDDDVGVRDVSRTIFAFCFVLGLVLAATLGFGDYTGFLLKFFTTDIPTQDALKPLLVLLIVAQPLNSFVFAADGVIQGASIFAYQAKSMVLSVLVAFVSFFCLQHLPKESESDYTLVHVWYSLLVLQLMRALTSLWKLVEPNGPIDLLNFRQGYGEL